MPNLKEQVAEVKERITALEEPVAAGDEQAIADAEAALAELADLEAKLAEAERKDGVLAQLKSAEPTPAAKEAPVNTLGDFALKNLNLDAMRAGTARSAGTSYGFKAYTDAQLSQQVLETSPILVDVVRDLEVRNAFGSEQISGNALKYFILGAREDNSAPAPGTVSENNAKPQFHIVEGSATATLQKIAGWFYETDELIEDNAFLKSAIDARGLYELDARVEAYLLSTLSGTSGIGTDTYTYGQDVDADTIFEAIMTVKTDSGLNADTIIIHPTDYQALRLAKDGNTQYYGGGYFYGPYGNGNVAQQPGLWGLRTIVTPNITTGTVLVGAFKQGASVITKFGDGARIEVFVGDHDDAIYNRVTVVVEERLALAVRQPKAFVKITEAASS